MSNSPYKIQRFVEIYTEYPADILREKSIYEWQDTEEEFNTFTEAAERARILELNLKPVNGFKGGYRIAGNDGDVWSVGRLERSMTHGNKRGFLGLGGAMGDIFVFEEARFKMEELMKHGNKSNQNALKAPESRADSHLHIRVNSANKARWEAQAKAQGVPLSVWVVYHLNEGVKS